MRWNISLLLVAVDMIIYLDKTGNRKWFESKRDFSKPTGYEINLEDSLAFLHTSNNQLWKTVRKVEA